MPRPPTTFDLIPPVAAICSESWRPESRVVLCWDDAVLLTRRLAFNPTLLQQIPFHPSLRTLRPLAPVQSLPLRLNSPVDSPRPFSPSCRVQMSKKSASLAPEVSVSFVVSLPLRLAAQRSDTDTCATSSLQGQAGEFDYSGTLLVLLHHRVFFFPGA